MAGIGWRVRLEETMRERKVFGKSCPHVSYFYSNGSTFQITLTLLFNPCMPCLFSHEHLKNLKIWTMLALLVEKYVFLATLEASRVAIIAGFASPTKLTEIFQMFLNF